MATPGELLGLGTATQFCEPLFGREKAGDRITTLSVCESRAGAYLGHFCAFCGPISRETGYMTREDAEAALQALSSTSPGTVLPKSLTLR